MKKNLFSFIAVLISVLMLVTVFAGCGTTQTGKETASGATSEEVNETTKAPEEQMDVKLSLLANKDHWTVGNQAVVDAYTAKTGIKIEVEVLPGGAESDNIMRTRLAAGQGSDIVTWMTGALMNTMAPNKNFIEITNEPFMDNIDEAFKIGASNNGKVLAVPLTPSQFGVWFYNKKVYADLGLQVPKTWAELLANCEKIKASGKTAIAAPYKDSWTTQMIVLEDYYNVKQAAPTLAADITANKVKLQNSPAYVRSWEKLQEVYKKGYINKDSLSMTYDMGVKALCEGTAVHFPMGSWVLGNITEKYADKANDIGAFVQPSDDASVNGITLWLPWGLFVTQMSKDIENSKKFLEFYISKEGCDAYSSKEKPSGPFLVKGIVLPEDVLPCVKDAAVYIESGRSSAALEFECPVKPTAFEKITQEIAMGFRTPLEGVKTTDLENEKYAKSQKMPGW